MSRGLEQRAAIPRDLSQIAPFVGKGVLDRVVNTGLFPPKKGPGRHSIPNAAGRQEFFAQGGKPVQTRFRI